MPSIVFALGKRPHDSSVVAAVLSLLRDRDFDVAVHLPHDDRRPASDWLGDVDLMVQRGLDADALQALMPIEEAGIHCCNSIRATGVLADRMLLCRRLGAGGIPVPRTEPAATWAHAEAVADGRPVVVKSRRAVRGRGAHVVMAADGDLPRASPFDGPFVVQDYVPGDGYDRKLYVAGHHLRGLLKPGLTRQAHTQSGTYFDPTPSLTRLGYDTGRVLALDIFGVDIVVGPTGPHVVDVNPFPGFRGVPDAATLIACHLGALAGPERRCTCTEPNGAEALDLAEER